VIVLAIVVASLLAALFIKKRQKVGVSGCIVVATGGCDPAHLFAGIAKKAIDSKSKFVILTSPGNQPVLLATHPDTAQEILQNQEVFVKDYDAFPHSTFFSMLETSLLFSKGADGRHQRETMTPAFHFDYLKSMIPMFVQKLSELLDRFPAGEVFDAKPLLFQCTVDILGIASFGVDFKSMTEGETHEYLSAYNTLVHAAATEFVGFIPPYIKKWLPFGSVQECNKARKAIISMTHEVMEARRSVAEKKYLADMMLAAQPPLSVEQLESNVFLFFSAGHETTASAFCWALKLLALHPDVQAKARAEVDLVLKGNHPNAENIKGLLYLEQVIKEVLRFGPVAIMPSRVATGDIQIGDVFIPNSTKVGFDAYTIHHNPEFWPNPEIFNPDRFSPDAKHHPYAYLPFSHGKRNCIGMNFSLLEQRVLLSMVLQKFVISTPDELKGVANINFQVPQTVNLVVEKR